MFPFHLMVGREMPPLLSLENSILVSVCVFKGNLGVDQRKAHLSICGSGCEEL